ncbi:MAG TPA: phosphoenolpyruvate--protein phosphotransferase [Terriglobia bacterium]|nr:phosphoenolpyruvate--protein phosphotransferase [Terriglobia bacterium]
MVGLVLVSHSKRLATGIKELILETAGQDFPIAVAAGAGDDHEQLGTDAVHIAQILQPFVEGDGAVVLMDFGSSVLSAEMALEILEQTSGPCPDKIKKIRLCCAPLVEGAIAAAVQARAGANLDEVCREALRALTPKQEQLHREQIGTPASGAAAPTDSQPTRELLLTIRNEHGLHARPAAQLVLTASRFSAEIEIANETAGRGPVLARSLTSIALLQVREGDRVRVRARGVDADAALQAVSQLAAAGFGEAISPAQISEHRSKPQPSGVSDQPVGEAHSGTPLIRGIPASEGVAVGRVLPLQNSLLAPTAKAAGEPTEELAKLTIATRRVQARLAQRNQRPAGAVLNDTAEIFAAQAAILSDPAVFDQVKALVERKRLSAARAWTEVTDDLVASYRHLDDPYLRERAIDVFDIAQLVLLELAGRLAPASIRPEPPAILYARVLLPSEAANCDPEAVLGVITSEGSAVTHSAIMLRTLGIPMVSGIHGLDTAAAAGKIVAMDGGTGEVWLEPAEPIVQTLKDRRKLWLARRQSAVMLSAQPAVTLDGVRIEVLANVASAADAVVAARNGADGVGVVRTELLFLERREAPTEAEQEEALRAIFAPIPAAHPIVVRTLDAGADKPLPFLEQPGEQNPYLGVRGIRLLLRNPDFFLTHLRAILTAGVGRNLWVMFPMISEVQEAERAREFLTKAHSELQTVGKSHAWPVKVGAMIEVPSAALLAAQLAEPMEFLSIGTNDLTQYALGAERGNAALAGFQDALHPAVLKLVRATVEGAKPRERHVAVCGDAASDPIAAAVFFGLGVRSLSVRPSELANVKGCFGQWRSSDVAELARLAIEARDAAEVRALAEGFAKRHH